MSEKIDHFPNFDKPDDMIYCELDLRHHGKSRRPKYPRWLLQKLYSQIEFAYPYPENPGPLGDRDGRRRQDIKRREYAIAFLNSADAMRSYFNAFNTLDTMLSDCMTTDSKKITKTRKVIDNLKNRAK